MESHVEKKLERRETEKALERKIEDLEKELKEMKESKDSWFSRYSEEDAKKEAAYEEIEFLNLVLKKLVGHNE